MSWAYTPAYTATRLRVLSAAGLCIVGVGFATLRWNTPAVRAQERLGVNTPIEDPTRTLAPRFRALFQEASTRLVRLSFWGTSHTASDQYTSVLREALQQRFGDGGSGTFLPARPMTFYDRRDIAFEASAGFVGVSTRRTAGTLVLGATGMVLDARRTATARVRVRHPSTGVARLWAVGIGPGRGRVALTIGGRHAERELEVGERAMVELSVAGCASGAGASGGCDVDRQPLIDVQASHARILALSVDASRGVVVESFGVSGARASDALRWDDGVFREQLVARPPDAVLLEYGTNESQGLGTGRERGDALIALIARFCNALPNALCVVIGPSNRPQLRSGRWSSNLRNLAVRDSHREAALAADCGFFDFISFEGGPSSMNEWVTQGYALDDHVHLSDAGNERLGTMLVAALLAPP